MRESASGFSLIEVLITVVLLAIGLLGLAAFQARTATVSIEAYQRTQGMLLAHDIADRIVANKPNAPRYVGDDYGSGPATACPAAAGVDRDLCVWANALRGGGEQAGGLAVGTLAGGRGCIRTMAADRFQIVVAWQGLLPTSAPAVDCGRNRYGNDALRRVIVVPLHLPGLAG